MIKTMSLRAEESAILALRRLAYTLSAELGQRVTVGDAMEVAVTMATRDVPASVATARELAEREVSE